jgi:hypothetical protein
VNVLRSETAPGGGSSPGAKVATFTTWMTAGQKMGGIVGGVVGEGEFVGQILDMTAGTPTVIYALYSLVGPVHAFTALVHVEQAGLTATINGIVTDGWAKGRLVNGQYTEIQAAHDGVTTDCWRGTLRIRESVAA